MARNAIILVTTALSLLAGVAVYFLLARRKQNEKNPSEEESGGGGQAVQAYTMEDIEDVLEDRTSGSGIEPQSLRLADSQSPDDQQARGDQQLASQARDHQQLASHACDHQQLASQLVEEIIISAKKRVVSEDNYSPLADCDGRHVTMPECVPEREDSLNLLTPANVDWTPDGLAGGYGDRSDQWSVMSALGSTQSSRRNSIASICRLVDAIDGRSSGDGKSDRPDSRGGPSTEDVAATLRSVQSSPQSLDASQADILVYMTSNSQGKDLEAALQLISRCASFTTNQDLLREAGCMSQLTQLLEELNPETDENQIKQLIQAINNMAMNERNISEMEECTLKLLDLMTLESCPQSILVTSLQALTNLSVTPAHHGLYTSAIQWLYDLIGGEIGHVTIPILKVLVNLSCNEDMVRHLLAAKAPNCVLEFLDPKISNDVTLRWCTFLANVMSTVAGKHITVDSLPVTDKAPSPETMYAALYSQENPTQLKTRAFVLGKCADENIKQQANRLYSVFKLE